MTGREESLGNMRKVKEGDVWEREISNEWRRLAQGNQYGVVSTDTINFVPASDVLYNCDVTYTQFFCDHCPSRSAPFRVRTIVGEDRLAYTHGISSSAAQLLETRLLLSNT